MTFLWTPYLDRLSFSKESFSAADIVRQQLSNSVSLSRKYNNQGIIMQDIFSLENVKNFANRQMFV